VNIFSFSLKNLKRRKMRTGLAVLGITLGVMLITSLLTIMDGLEISVTESLELLSGNLIIQKKGAVDQSASIVNLSLISYLSENEDIKAISPEIYVPRAIRAGSIVRFITLIGITDSYREMVSQRYVKTGTYFNASDRGKALLGKKLAEYLGKNVGDTLIVDSMGLNITGIFETATFADFLVVIIPIADARAISGLSEDQVSIIEVKPVNPDKTDAIKEYVESTFDEYEAIFPEDLAKEATDILNTLRNTIWIVSSIAVLIGGIGIANVMLMSVMERTPEIGLLKATGWRNIDVGYSVLLEALGIGVIGGFIGIFFGVIAAQTAENLIPALSVRLTLITLVESFAFAVALSLVSGIYPAVKAARLSPIGAIRGE